METIIHLLNRRGSEGERTILCLTHIITYDNTFDKIFSNDIQLLIDIMEDVIDKNMTNEQRESLVYLLSCIVARGDFGERVEIIRSICKNLNEDTDLLTERCQSLISTILESVSKT